LDVARVLRRRDGRPDPPGVREAGPPRRHPGHLHRESGLRGPAFRPARLRGVRGPRAHRAAAPGPRDVADAQRVAVLPQKRRGPRSHSDRADRALHLQPPRATPTPGTRRVASDGGVRRIQDGRALDRQPDPGGRREAMSARRDRSRAIGGGRGGSEVPRGGGHRTRGPPARCAVRNRPTGSWARGGRIRDHGRRSERNGNRRGHRANSRCRRQPSALRDRVPRLAPRIASGGPIRCDSLLGPCAGSSIHRGRPRVPSSPCGTRPLRRAARLGPAEPRLLRVSRAAVRLPHDRVAGAARVPVVRRGDRRSAIGVEVLRANRRGSEAPHRFVRGAHPPHAEGRRRQPRTIGLADRRRLGRMATRSRDRGPSETDRPRNTHGLKREGRFPRGNMALTAFDTVAVTAFLAVALSIFGRKMYLRLRYLFTAQRKEPRWDRLPTRVKNFVVYGIFQRKVAREWYAGVLHSFIFWAFVILGASVVEITAQAYAPGCGSRPPRSRASRSPAR